MATNMASTSTASMNDHGLTPMQLSDLQDAAQALDALLLRSVFAIRNNQWTHPTTKEVADWRERQLVDFFFFFFNVLTIFRGLFFFFSGKSPTYCRRSHPPRLFVWHVPNYLPIVFGPLCARLAKIGIGPPVAFQIYCGTTRLLHHSCIKTWRIILHLYRMRR